MPMDWIMSNFHSLNPMWKIVIKMLALPLQQLEEMPPVPLSLSASTSKPKNVGTLKN